MVSSPSGRPPSSTGRRGFARALPVLLGLAVIAGCSGSDGDAGGARKSTTTATTAPTTTAPGTAPTPRATLREAVEALLSAERAGDDGKSFRLLGPPARKIYRDVADWATRRSQLPAVTGFEIQPGDDPDTVVAVVTHPPGLDPFIGLSPARERQTFTGVEQDGGWLVENEPEVEFLLPPDAAAATAVRTWGRAVQTCDEAAAGRFEAVDRVFGASEGAGQLCRSRGDITVGEVAPLESGPQSGDLVAQYSTDVFEWARVVPVTAPTAPFSVVVAPIGDVWKIVAVYD